jgi:hypothetical protein
VICDWRFSGAVASGFSGKNHKSQITNRQSQIKKGAARAPLRLAEKQRTYLFFAAFFVAPLAAFFAI